MKRMTLGLLGVALLQSSAWAGQQYVDKTGYALSGYDVVAYWDKAQAPIGTPQARAVAGKASITADHNGAKWAFSSTANRDRFLADPAKYVPAYDGHCAYGASKGGKVPGNPHLWRIVDGKLYLNITNTVVGFWEEDIPGHIRTANKNWSSKLDPLPASDRVVPSFDVKGAPL